MKTKRFKKKQKGIAERKTEVTRKYEVPYKTLGLGISLWLFVTWLFFGQGIVRTTNLAEGQKAPSTIVASVDFECENLSETSFSRNKAAAGIHPVFNVDPAPVERAIKLTEKLFDRMIAYQVTSTNQRPQLVNSMSDLLMSSQVEPMELIAVFPSNTLAQTKTKLISGIKKVMNTGILSDEYRVTLFREAPDRPVTLLRSDDQPAETINQQTIYSTRKAVWAISGSFEFEPQRNVLDRLLPLFVVDNMTYNEAETEARRKEAAEAVEPVMQTYLAGTALVRAGEAVTPQTLRLMKNHEQQRIADQDALEQILEIIGNGILLLAGLIATSVILRVGNPGMVRQPDKIMLLLLLSISTLGLARLLTYLSVQYTLISPSLLMYLVPYALSVLLAGILLGGSAAISLGFWCSFASAVLFDQSFAVFALGILVTITAASTARNVHRRASLFRAGLWVCAVKVLFVLVVGILNRPAIGVLTGQILAAIVSGMLATVFTLLLIPVFEKLFKITTDITLLELSDMGHPLLQKMAMQAPGTYHHSLMVATLSQNAAEAIGVNSLLVRVCAYYHDIGKMAKPEFFTENIQHTENPHDDLSPNMSALIIISHVKEGVALAKRHKLPQPIIDGIEQHHGNGLIRFFYHKAKKQAESNGSVDTINESDFRYGGPPAVTPEMAILSLADASEASARSIEKPTPQKITNMIESIFTEKIRDGQLDYAKLTMAQINTVKQSLIFSLSNMLHGRIPYPKADDNSSSKSTAKISGSGNGTSKAS